MADSKIAKPIGISTRYISSNNNLKNDGWIRVCVCGNVVQVCGNIVMSDSFPISWTDTIISTDAPKTNQVQFCGIVRFDTATIAPAVVVAKEDGLYISSRNVDVRGQVGIIMATYIIV